MKLIKRLLHFRFYVQQWRKAEEATRKSEWSIVIENLEELHRVVPPTRRTRACLGSAYLLSGENEKAVQQFERIRRPLRDSDTDAVTATNHAVALERLGRARDAAAVLEAKMTDDWPDDRLRNASRYLRELKRA